MNQTYKAKILKILPGSIAELHGLKPGNSLLTIDNKAIKDLLDYQFAIYDAEKLSLLVEKDNHKTETILIKKPADDDLGIIFESGVFDKIKACNNKCIFCFVDQQPPGLRDSLYIKDDDYRLSYLQGTYITLTNLTTSDKKRIEDLRLGPLYISVHTTNPDLRIKILNNKKAGDILEKLQWLEDLCIPVHAQIVVCPGVNDGEELKKTLNDLIKLENIETVAIVPVGITKYRGQSILKPFTKELALETLEIIDTINKEKEFTFAFPSDEIFMLADKDIPSEEYYEGFNQLEDGVGLARLTLDQFNSINLPQSLKKKKHIGVITASLAEKILAPAFTKLNNIKDLKLDIIKINNNYWGKHITICGLIVGTDIITQLSAITDIPKDIFLPSIMLRKFSNEFLDGVTTDNIESLFDIKLHILQDPYSFNELIDFINQ